MRLAVLAVVLLAAPAYSQTATLTVFDVNGAEVSTQDHALECGLVPKFVESPPLVNPVESYQNDPEDETKDCRALIAGQVQSLPPAQGYRMARLEDGEYMGLSNQFTVGEPPPPPTTCVYQGFEYEAPHTLTPDLQLRATTAATDVAAMEAAGWTMMQVKANKRWQWWNATCQQ